MMLAPDVGVGDEVAHYYFNQLLAGMVCIPLPSFLPPFPLSLPLNAETHLRNTSTPRAYATATSNPKTSY